MTSSSKNYEERCEQVRAVAETLCRAKNLNIRVYNSRQLTSNGYRCVARLNGYTVLWDEDEDDVIVTHIYVWNNAKSPYEKLVYTRHDAGMAPGPWWAVMPTKLTKALNKRLKDGLAKRVEVTSVRHMQEMRREQRFVETWETKHVK